MMCKRGGGGGGKWVKAFRLRKEFTGGLVVVFKCLLGSGGRCWAFRMAHVASPQDTTGHNKTLMGRVGVLCHDHVT